MRVKQQLKLVLFVEVEQKLEQGLCAIGNHVPLVVMRVEHRWSMVSVSSYGNHAKPWSLLILWKTMLRMLSYELSKSWNMDSVSLMGYHAPPVVMTV